MPTFPTITTEVAFASLPGAAVPTWTDISAYVKAIEITGAHRQREVDRFEAGTARILLDNSVAAGARFDPNNASGAYSPNVLPMRRIRVRAVWASVTYDLFNGYVEDWPQSTNYPFEGAVQVKATDGFLALEAAPLDGSPYEVEVRADGPVAWWRLSDTDAAGPMTDTIGGYDGQYEALPGTGGPSLVAGQSLPSTHFDHLFTSSQRGAYLSTSGPPLTGYPWAVEAVLQVDAGHDDELRDFFQFADLTNGARGLEMSVNNGGGSFPAAAAGKFAVFLDDDFTNRAIYSSVPVSDGAEHHVAVDAASATDVKVFVDGVECSIVHTSGVVAFPTAPLRYCAGNGRPRTSTTRGLHGYLAEVAVYNHTLGAARIAAHAEAMRTAWKNDLSGARVTKILDAAGWPAGDRDIDAGQSTLQAQTFNGALSALQAVAESEFGAVFCTPGGAVKFRDRHALLKAPYTTSLATFTDQTTGVNYDEIEPDFAVDAIKNVARVARSGGPIQRAEDSTSIGRFFRRRYEKSGLLLEKDAEARDQAQYVVNRYKDPPFRFGKLKLTPYGVETTLFPLILGLAIGDRVTVVQQPPGEAATNTRDVHVDGKTLRIGVGDAMSFECDLQLSPVDPTTYFVLGTSTLGGAHVLGY